MDDESTLIKRLFVYWHAGVCSKCREAKGWQPRPERKVACLGCGAEYTWEEWVALKPMPE